MQWHQLWLQFQASQGLVEARNHHFLPLLPDEFFKAL